MYDQTTQATKQALDGTIGVGAVTWPIWVQYLQTGGAIFTFLGGLILLCLRIMIAWHEWQARNKPKGGA